MKHPPKPRQRVYDLYWYFAAERQAIFEKRLRNLPAPWTTDPILATYKFCNVFRASDRVSQYLIRHVCYHSETCTPADKLFQIIAFRMFSKPRTWRFVREQLGHYPQLHDVASGAFTSALAAAKKQLPTMYTSAFILCANNVYGQPWKYLNHVELFKHMFLTDNLADELLAANSLQEVFRLLRAYPLIGNFMAYQIAIDLNYSELINFSENDFTVAGPGALRGLAKVFEHLGNFTPEETIMWMVARQKQEFERLGFAFRGLHGRPLHAIDVQGLFCEVDKYCRVAVPELTSARTQIKSRFVADASSLEYFYPPKWQLNDAL